MCNEHQILEMPASVHHWHEKSLAIELDERSKALRRQVIKMLKIYKRGHIGPTLSLIEILRVLYDSILRFDSADPDWKERDRCILSKGHGCIAQYIMLADKGFIAEKDLWSFCQYEALLGGHPDSTKIPGIEASTGSLGHGLSVGAGIAMALKKTARRSKVFVIMGDGECDEGSVWEACLSAGNHGLDNLVALVDYNKYQAYDAIHVIQNLEPLADKFASFGLAVRNVNGHDVAALDEMLSAVPFEPGKPSVLICHTVKGKGIPMAENNLDWHFKSEITDQQMEEIENLLRQK